MRWVGRLFGQSAADVYRGGIVVSWTAFVLAMIGLYYLARLDIPSRRAERAVVLAAVFPFAFFFGVVYTESLFLLLTVTTFYAFRTRHWIWGGLAGALATATRVNGLLMLPALAWLAWREVGPDRRERVLAVAGLALVPVGIGLTGVHVHADGQSLRVGGVDSALGLLSRRVADGWRRFDWSAPSSRIRMHILPASAWRPTTP